MAINEADPNLWHHKTRGWARKAWVGPFQADFGLNIPVLDRAANTTLGHRYDVVHAIVLGKSNAASESVNSWVQALKRRANGPRSRTRFRDAIDLQLGGLDLHPRPRFDTGP